LLSNIKPAEEVLLCDYRNHLQKIQNDCCCIPNSSLFVRFVLFSNSRFHFVSVRLNAIEVNSGLGALNPEAVQTLLSKISFVVEKH
jgi:hypothetical protein